ncbi:unnamed protein product [Oncorhynchus mykiss]|uniref:Uncharacterized protein n=1 Tax=Oncorhynchus mykiss TaxID=8022 RepID=A0A060WEU8_ONCMY|nr:unnamed protein product [Oncorhynchus mykiss]
MPYAILPKEVPSGSKKVVTPLVWNKQDSQYSVPLWIIILAILAGLLLLALLIYVLYKMNVVPSGIWKLLPRMNQTCGGLQCFFLRTIACAFRALTCKTISLSYK